MKSSLRSEPSWRSSGKAGFAILSAVSSIALASVAQAATISDSATAPSADILISQLTALGPGEFDANRLYADNGGPPGETFMVPTLSNLQRITVLGRGDSAGSWNNGPQPMTGVEVWGIQIAQVNGDGSLTELRNETATGFAAPANLATYLSFDLASPVALNPGITYAFSIKINAGWYGLAHGGNGVDAYTGGYGFNNNTSIANPGDNSSPKNTFNGFAAPIPANIDFVFALQGTAVPEPATAAFLALGAIGLVLMQKRRRA